MLMRHLNTAQNAHPLFLVSTMWWVPPATVECCIGSYRRAINRTRWYERTVLWAQTAVARCASVTVQFPEVCFYSCFRLLVSSERGLD